MSATSDGRGFRLTGRKVLVLIVLFFGAIFAVNGAMVYFAISTFPGLEVASSYRAGQEYEAEVAAGKAQTDRRWRVGGSVVPEGPGARVAFDFVDSVGAAIEGLTVAVHLVHAVDPTHDHVATLSEVSPGHYQTDLADVPDGHWSLEIEALRGDDRLFKSRNDLLIRR